MNQNKPHYVDINKITLRLPVCKDSDGETYVAISDVRRILTEAPAEDVEKVKHGKWVKLERTWPLYSETYECSKCGRTITVGDGGTKSSLLKRYPYCHCGARMDGDEK